jgi:inosose dehydratase
MNIGCFALIYPFSPLRSQLDQIAKWGFQHADITDNGDGATLGTEFGFGAVASLDANPADLKRLFAEYGLTISSWCAHANLLDPAAPWRYGTAQIIKAVKMASLLGIRYVITTEGEPSTPFGHRLTPDEKIFTILEKLHEPLRLAEDLGVKLLLEPHGPVSDDADQLERLVDAADSSALAINLDTGNLWLGGGDPVSFVKRFGAKIEHVHWKDLPAEMIPKRGTLFGCGMATIPLGTGVVDIAGTMGELRKAGFDGDITLEVAGEESVLASRKYLQSLLA